MNVLLYVAYVVGIFKIMLNLTDATCLCEPDTSLLSPLGCRALEISFRILSFSMQTGAMPTAVPTQG